MVDWAASHHDGSCGIVIPARMGSTRFPGKPLVKLKGANGTERTLIEWTWRAAMSVPKVDCVVVATDDRRIVEQVERFGGRAIMTPADCINGTERCAAVLDQLPGNLDIIVNFQGDSPLSPPQMVTALLDRMKDRSIDVATPAIEARNSTRTYLMEEQRAGRVGGTTVVTDRHGRALYFSKAVLPNGATRDPTVTVLLHLGLYAYRPGALAAYRSAPPSMAECAEGLEQLRFLDQGTAISVVVCSTPEGTMAELNNPADRAVLEAEFARRGME